MKWCCKGWKSWPSCFVSRQVKSRYLQKSNCSWVRHHPSQIFHQSGQFLSIYPSRLMLDILRYPSDWYDKMEVSSQIPMPSKKPLFLGHPCHAFHQPSSVMQGSFWPFWLLLYTHASFPSTKFCHARFILAVLGSVLSDTIQWCSQGWKCGHSLLASQILMPSKKLLFLGQMSRKPDFSLAKSMVLLSQI